MAQIGIVVWVRRLGLTGTAATAARPADYSNTAELGHLLYTQYLYPFELAAMLLLLAIVAAIFCPIKPDFPMPDTTTLPLQA